MAARDDIGKRGEFIFSACIMNFCGRNLPFFRPYFLGEKAQALDFLVELVDAGDHHRFFFVQVKTTQNGYTKNGRLRVRVAGKDVHRLAGVPAPTYLVGIDEQREVAYILAILADMKGSISSLPTDFPLDSKNLKRLSQEVEQFWAGHDLARRHSIFSVEK